ncbi:MAG: hypothetical protein AB1758_00210 [Candidatus Eremiobacterota bacterium]
MNVNVYSPYTRPRIQVNPRHDRSSERAAISRARTKEAGYREVVGCMIAGAAGGAVAGGLAGVYLSFHPCVMAAAGLVTGAWAGLGIGFVRALRDAV